MDTPATDLSVGTAITRMTPSYPWYLASEGTFTIILNSLVASPLLKIKELPGSNVNQDSISFSAGSMVICISSNVPDLEIVKLCSK